jgi:IS5 family transposase
MEFQRNIKRGGSFRRRVLRFCKSDGKERNSNPQRQHSGRYICRHAKAAEREAGKPGHKGRENTPGMGKEKNRHKKAQKDVDARWATKNKEIHFGYKNHIKVDKKSKIITKHQTTSAEAHDSQEGEKDKIIYGDSAYTGEEVQKCIPENVKNRIHEKGYRNKPLTETQKKNNTAKSRIRVRVEHVFGAMRHFGEIFIRTIGIKRAEFQIGLLNLTYNLTRYAYLMGAKA